MSDSDNVLPFRLRDMNAPVGVDLDPSVLLFAGMGDIRAKVLAVAGTRSTCDALIQVLLVVAEHLLRELEGSGGAVMTRSGLHRRNARLRARQLVELARELAALNVTQGGE